MASQLNDEWEADLGTLIGRGASVSIVDGILHMKDANGDSAPTDWLSTKQFSIAEAIGKKLSVTIYRYLDYSVGNYLGGSAPGICLRFEDVASGHLAFVISIADLTRERTTEWGKAGTPLPPHQFRVRRGSSFLKFWKRAGLPLPKRLAAFTGKIVIAKR